MNGVSQQPQITQIPQILLPTCNLHLGLDLNLNLNLDLSLSLGLALSCSACSRRALD
jgi:hypothetical protein